MRKQKVVIGILANAGGVGKTTLAVHLAQEVSQQGVKVAILDLDPQRSLQVTALLTDVEKLSPTAIASANPDQLIQLRQALQQKLSYINEILN